MNKKALAIAAAVVVCIVLVVILKMSGVSPDKGDVRGVEASVPTIDFGKDHVVARIQNIDGVRGMISGVKSLLPDMPDLIVRIMRSKGLPDIAEDLEIPDVAVYVDPVSKVIDVVDAFLAAGDEAVFAIGSSGDGEEAVLAMIAREEKYAKLKDQFASFGLNVADDEASNGADESFSVESELGVLHIVSVKDGGRRLLILADDIEGAAKSIAAWNDPAKRASIPRHLSEPNYITYRLSEETLPTITKDMNVEIAWNTEGKTTSIKTYANAPKEGVAASGLEKEPLTFYGEGEPALLAALDLPYLISAAEMTPEEVLSLIEDQCGLEIPDEYRSAIVKVLSSARFSYGVFMDPNALIPKTAYIQLEMDDTSDIDQYMMLASFLGMKTTDVSGWDSVMSTNIDENFSVTLAKGKGKVLAGIGAPEVFGKKVDAPGLSGGALSYFFASTKYITGTDTALGKMLHDDLANDEEYSAFVELMDKLGISKISSITGVQKDASSSETKIAWR